VGFKSACCVKKAPLWRNSPPITQSETIKKAWDWVHPFSIVPLPQQIKFIQADLMVCIAVETFFLSVLLSPPPTSKWAGSLGWKGRRDSRIQCSVSKQHSLLKYNRGTFQVILLLCWPGGQFSALGGFT
jgi:hypothetical protein